MLIAAAGHRELAATTRILRSRTFRSGLAYMHAAFIPIAVAFYILRPDWMFMYWVDADRVPVAVVVLAFLMYEVCFIAGFTVAATLRRRTAFLTAGVLGLAVFAGEVAARDRLLALTPERVARPFEISFSPWHVTPLGWALLICVPLSIAALGAVMMRVARIGVR